MKSPVWVPRNVLRVTTRSSSATCWWMSACSPENAAWNASWNALTPSRPGGMPGAAEWSTTSSGMSSSSTSSSRPFWYSVTNRFTTVLVSSLITDSLCRGSALLRRLDIDCRLEILRAHR